MKIILFLLISCSLSAQTYDGLYRQKVKTMDSTIETLYSVISGDKGERRDWALFKYLFADGAQLCPLRTDANGKTTTWFISPEEYIESSGAYLEANGFFEKETHRVVEQYGNLTHIFSTYDSYRTSKDTEPFARGINSIQLMKDRGRWYVVNITWQSETEEFPLPGQYLEKG